MDESKYVKTEDKNGVITFTPVKREVKCWEDLEVVEGYFLDGRSDSIYTKGETVCLAYRSVFATKEQCKASEAFAMLTQLMKKCNGDWVPDWLKGSRKFVICYQYDRLVVKETFSASRRFLAFETPEIRDRFLELHINLINQAKPLL